MNKKRTHQGQIHVCAKSSYGGQSIKLLNSISTVYNDIFSSDHR